LLPQISLFDILGKISRSFHSVFLVPTDDLPFPAIFPGYYTGRALHVHAKVFPEWKELPNGTFEAGRLAHVGQFFFDDQLEEAIDRVRGGCVISIHVSRELGAWDVYKKGIEDGTLAL